MEDGRRTSLGAPSTLAAAAIAIGLIIGGLLVGRGFAARGNDRFVTVKGVSEREVRADLAIWPLRVVGADNELTRAHAKLTSSVDGVRRFLIRHGIDTATVELTNFTVSDAQANQYASDREPANRYIIQQTMLVRSTDAEKILAASQQISDLAAVGVTVSSGQGEYGPASGPSFIFTGLNALKPPMIAEATARAREGAEQFAKDSRSSLGGIRRANQGQFEILPRDAAPGISEESQIAKRVRVVSTIEFYLK
jgi:hypothetical protein